MERAIHRADAGVDGDGVLEKTTVTGLWSAPVELPVLLEEEEVVPEPDPAPALVLPLLVEAPVVPAEEVPVVPVVPAAPLVTGG